MSVNIIIKVLNCDYDRGGNYITIIAIMDHYKKNAVIIVIVVVETIKTTTV